MSKPTAHTERPVEFESLAELIDRLAHVPDRPALCVMRPEEIQHISRAELFDRIRPAAGALVKAGLQRGDSVILWAENAPEWIIACLAVIRGGGRIVPLDVQLDRPTLERIIQDCEPRFILTFSRRLERLREVSCDLPRVLLLDQEAGDDTLWRLPAGQELPDIEATDGAALFYTSGTTGPAKGVPLSHANLSFQINRILETDLARQGDRLLLPLPLHHVYPFAVGMLLPLALRVCIILPQALTGPQILRAIRQAEATIICGVPRLYRALYDAIAGRVAAGGGRRADLFDRLVNLSGRLRQKLGWRVGRLLFLPLHRRVGTQLRLLASGGSALAPELARKLEGLGWQVAIGYGLTETAPLLTLNPPGSQRFDSVGQALPGVAIKLDYDAGRREGEGEVLARGPNVFAGYHRLPEKTEQAFSDGWFRTGDLGRVDEAGFLKIGGRVSTLIVTESGENINPVEVEEAYGDCPQIEEIGVLEQNGRLVALVVPAAGTDNDRGAIEAGLARMAEPLPSYWQLAEVALTGQSLPRTRLGKLRRHLLEERYQAARAGEQSSSRQQPVALEEMSGADRDLLDDAAARAVWDWLAERYHDRDLTPDTRLQAELGIDSLEWMTVTVEVGERTGFELSEAAIAEIKTVRDLLAQVAAGDAAASKEFGGQPLEHPEAVLSDAQQRWLKPPGVVLQRLQRALFGLNRLVLKLLFDLQVTGLDQLPEKPCVFAPNHLSALDPPAIAAVLPQDVLIRTWWGGWTGIAFGNRLTRLGSRLTNVVPVDPERAAISSLAFGAAVVRAERSLVWFPEGRRAQEGEIESFKPGIGLVLSRYPVPVVPILIEGTGRLLPIGRWLPRRGTIRLTFGRPLDPGELIDDERDAQENAKAITARLEQAVRDLRSGSEPAPPD